MKKVLFICCMLLTTSMIAQDITKEVGEFTELKVYDLINVEMIKSKKNKIEISGKNAHDVVVVNKNGKLKIKLNLEEIFDGNKTRVKLYYTSVDIIDANEGAYITSDKKIKQFEVALRAQEGGIINLNLDTKETEIRSVTGGIIELQGKTDNQTIKIGTGGILKGEDFKSTTAKLSINAGGEAYVNASDLLDIKIRAGGDVYIYGDPETVNESRALGGRIKRME